MYGPPRIFPQATNSLLVCPSFSEMSPAAPGLSAKIGWIGRLPLVITHRSPLGTGAGIVASDFFASRHNSLPVAGSYPRAYCEALVTISVRFEFFHTVGVLHDGISSRGVDHTRDPSSRLYAAMNESWLRSNWRMTSPSWITGELPKPHSYSRSMAKLESIVLRSGFQSICPSKT